MRSRCSRTTPRKTSSETRSVSDGLRKTRSVFRTSMKKADSSASGFTAHFARHSTIPRRSLRSRLAGLAVGVVRETAPCAVFRDVARILRILAACRTTSGNVVRTLRVLTASGKSLISRNDERALLSRTKTPRSARRMLAQCTSLKKCLQILCVTVSGRYGGPSYHPELSQSEIRQMLVRWQVSSTPNPENPFA